MIQRIVFSVCSLMLTGVLFAVFLLGYVFYAALWSFRFVQPKKKAFLFALGCSVPLALATGFFFLFMPLGRVGEHITIVVPRGCSVRGVADSLVRRDIIASKQAFVLWLKITGVDRKIQAGRYSFVKKQGAIAAARALERPVTLDRTITLPEGLTIEQTAARIVQVFPFDTTEIIRLCHDTGFIRTTGLDSVSSLEGYLFPDTYRFLETASPGDIIRRMVAHFAEAYAAIDTVAASLTKKEIVTLASIVEKEAVLANERSRIAGVFSNRLALHQPLGADPTVRYVLKKFNGPLTISDLAIPSPYNTRRYGGLPPGPICSPGRASLIAAMSPTRTNELYFVARWDGSGAHDFSATNEEHSRKKLAIRHHNMKRLQMRGLKGDSTK